jgi:multidrug efflux system membrane fusion protein
MHGELPKPNLKPDLPDGKPGARRKRGRRWLATLLVLIAVIGALAYVYYPAPEQHKASRRSRFAASGGPVPVLVAPAVRADVPVYLETVGTTRALNMVTVRPQVDGKLLAVTFNEGQDVKKGDVLARIDPTLYQAQLDQAVAKKAQDEAVLANAKNDLARYQKLAATNAINRQQADTQKALVAQDTAQVQADIAAIETARATLGYTTIKAPITGRTGIRMVDEGNIVHASDTNSAIVTITQLQPISVTFSLPQQDLGKVIDAFAKGPLPVDAQRSDTGAVIDRGKLTVIDNQVDPATGTVKLKAEFPNAKLQLWPGQFVNVRLLVNTLKQVVVIPTGAVQRGPDGTFVYVVNNQNKAAMRSIAVERQDENQTVVKSGVAPPDRVVTTGFARLKDGSAVQISTGNSTPAAAEAKAGGRPHGARSHNGGNGAPRQATQRNGGSRKPAPPQ